MRQLAEILADFKQPIPPEFISQKPIFKRYNGQLQKTGEVDYISWPHLCSILDRYTEGFWNWEIRTQFLGDRVVVEGKLTILTTDGNFIREATGWESLEVDGYGDSTSNAEAMAFRRSCAKFGIGLYLRNSKSDKPKNPQPNRKKGELTREEWLAKQGRLN